MTNPFNMATLTPLGFEMVTPDRYQHSTLPIVVQYLHGKADNHLRITVNGLSVVNIRSSSRSIDLLVFTQDVVRTVALVAAGMTDRDGVREALRSAKYRDSLVSRVKSNDG